MGVWKSEDGEATRWQFSKGTHLATVMIKPEYACSGDAGALLRTTDRGGTWAPVWSGFNGTLSSIVFIDSLRGWMVGMTLAKAVQSKILFRAAFGAWNSRTL